MPRQCLFCRNPADSGEHLWSDWILRRLSIKDPMFHRRGGRPGKFIPRAEIEINCVCQRVCNGGWMHRLEDLNIPIIGPMMSDEPINLSLEQQTIISKWAVMKAMVQDAIETRSRALFYTSEERYAIPETETIPDNTKVWLGRYSHPTLYLSATDITLDMYAGNEIPGTAHSCLNTIVVGHLALQVLTVHVPEKYSGRDFEINCTVPAPWDAILIPVWPISETLSWPPRYFLKNVVGIEKLAERFSGGIRI